MMRLVLGDDSVKLSYLEGYGDGLASDVSFPDAFIIHGSNVE